MFVPVKHWTGTILMPTTPSRARRWVKSMKATPYWDHGVFCVRLNEPCGKVTQPIAVGIDPGSKKEAFTVKSQAHTYLNVQADAVTWVKQAMKTRSALRSNRRRRNTPYRINRRNRSHGGLPPSTKARWQWKLRICRWLAKVFPIASFIVEDIKAETKKYKRRWNSSFSPLQIGKNWFYRELRKIATVELRLGWQTKDLRDSAGLKKSKSKLSNRFDAHCVDSWVLANWMVGGHTKPDNQQMLFIVPLHFRRRALHYQNPKAGGIRSTHGGAVSLGWRRGSLVNHIELGICYVGGTSNGSISLHQIQTGKRLGRDYKKEDCQFITHSSWRFYSN